MKGDFDSALDYYQQAVDANPDYIWGPMNVARTIRQAKWANGEAMVMPSSTENQDAKMHLMLVDGIYTILIGIERMKNLAKQLNWIQILH